MHDLIERLKCKEKAAFEEVMTMYKKPVFNYLNLLLGDRDVAEELTQDTFVKVYFKAHSLRTDNLKSWIFKIAVNLARSEFRRRKLKRLLSLDDVSESHVAYQPDFEMSLALEQSLAVLPVKYRIPLLMKEAQNLSFEEIAQVLQKPIGTVKSLVFRGREQLKSAYHG
jgi:RNA polymerase sigma-70 factor, ECF subfamily